MGSLTTGVASTAVAVLFVGGELNGAPTDISQRCPGCPCGGFIPGAVLTELCCTACGAETGVELVVTTGDFEGVVAAAGAEFSGAPTAISQR